MDNRTIYAAALRQSAIDLACDTGDFTRQTPVCVLSRTNDKARRYLSLPFSLQLVSYGSNVVASASPALLETAKSYIDGKPPYRCFETPSIHRLDAMLSPFGQKVCFMAEYFLPDIDRLTVRECAYPTRLLTQKDFADLYKPEWSNALCEKRKALDVLGIAAFDKDEMIGFAACSADCDEMWQIGIDVLPAYRRKGIASHLTAALAVEILRRGKVPFYCAAWSNIPSVRNAVRCGFVPAWVELTAKDNAFVTQMNA